MRETFVFKTNIQTKKLGKFSVIFQQNPGKFSLNWCKAKRIKKKHTKRKKRKTNPKTNYLQFAYLLPGYLCAQFTFLQQQRNHTHTHACIHTSIHTYIHAQMKV